MKLWLGFAALLVGHSVAFGATFEGRARRYPYGTLINDVALNAAAASRTLTLDLDYPRDGYDSAVFHVVHTNSAGALDIIMSCTVTPTAGDTAGAAQECTLSSGVCTSDDASWKKSVTGSKAWVWRVDIGGYPGDVKCVFSAAGAGANDKITVKSWLVTE